MVQDFGLVQIFPGVDVVQLYPVHNAERVAPGLPAGHLAEGFPEKVVGQLGKPFHVAQAGKMGYHLRKTFKGQFGEISKIEEELDELKEALEQENKIMAMCELSDVYGALKGYLEKHFPSVTMDDLKTMAEATERAFKDGDR